jgi:hypothetical protein
MTAGLSAAGLTIKTLEEIKAELEAAYLAEIDASLDLSPDQPMGQVVAINAQRESLLWELLATVYNMFNPNAAEGAMLENVSAITGTLREPSDKSTVTLACVVTAGFTQVAGAMMANVSGQDTLRFVNVDDVGPLAAGTHDIDFEAVDYGEVVANAGTLTVITAPVSGWTSCTNALDAELGREQEEDTPLRLRREDELSAAGASTVDSIRADVLQVDGVEQCYVFENVTLTTDADGIPGKAFEVVVFDGTTPAADDDEIAQTIWDSKPSGAATYGTESTMVTDSTATEREVQWSRADVKEVYLTLTDVVIDPRFFPTDGEDLIKDAIVAYGVEKLGLGVDVFALAMRAAALEVDGVLDVPTLTLGFSASPVGTTNLTITGREIAELDTSRIIVSTVEGSP